MFQGFVVLEATIKGVVLVESTSDVPIDADAYPTFRVYGPDGYLGVSGTCTYLGSGSITGATNATPIVITSASHGLTTGTRVTISGVGGNTAANTTAVITYVSANTFSLDGVAGNGAYTSGGTWHLTGLYRWSVDALGASGFESGECYNICFNFAISSTQKGDLQSFFVT